MSRVSRTRNALAAVAAAAFLAVGATAAPAQAANGTITWVNGGDYKTMTLTNPAGRSCWPVGLHSYDLKKTPMSTSRRTPRPPRGRAWAPRTP
ncbi:hypothetical protein GT039_14600 [Streptomyces sp. SID2955]|nr:hypothetical protein [Streptomyces sp. SID2955]